MRHVRPDTRRDEDDKLFIGAGSTGDAAPRGWPVAAAEKSRPLGPCGLIVAPPRGALAQHGAPCVQARGVCKRGRRMEEARWTIRRGRCTDAEARMRRTQPPTWAPCDAVIALCVCERMAVSRNRRGARGPSGSERACENQMMECEKMAGGGRKIAAKFGGTMGGRRGKRVRLSAWGHWWCVTGNGPRGECA